MIATSAALIGQSFQHELAIYGYVGRTSPRVYRLGFSAVSDPTFRLAGAAAEWLSMRSDVDMKRAALEHQPGSLGGGTDLAR